MGLPRSTFYDELAARLDDAEIVRRMRRHWHHLRTSGYDVERELRACAEVAGLRWRTRRLFVIARCPPLSKDRNWGDSELCFLGSEAGGERAAGSS